MALRSEYFDAVEVALKNFDATWLGNHSPLAAPYFLGDKLRMDVADAPVRGRVLQGLIRNACTRITGEYAERYKTIITEYYFRGRTRDAVLDILSLGRNRFNENRRSAIERLAEELLQIVRPALRLESPPAVGELFERGDQVARCLYGLQAGKAVALTGSSGTGKTMLAAQVVEMSQRRYFWYTLRDGLTDHLESLLFAFGYFLLQHGQNMLWTELPTRSEPQKIEQALGIVRYSLERFSMDERPILVLDNVDILRPSENSIHAALWRFLLTLRGLVPILYVGQQMPLEADLYLPLQNLKVDSVRKMLRTAEGKLKESDINAIHSYTDGNPRLLELCTELLRTGSSASELLEILTQLSSVEYLIEHTFSRLDNTERRIMAFLSVLRQPAPIDVWHRPEQVAALNRLLDHHLVIKDRHGGIDLLSTYRSVIYQKLTIAERQHLHAIAATMRAERGSFTAATYHLIQSGKITEALLFWDAHKSEAIEEGQATLALHMFQELEVGKTETEIQERLSLIRGDLQRHCGQNRQGISDLRSRSWQNPVLAVEANELEGVMSNDLGEFEEAAVAFEKALSVSQQLIEGRLANIHKGLGWMHMQQRELDRAWDSANRAHYEVENLRGNIQMYQCDYSAAEAHFTSAMETARQVEFLDGIAKTCNSLSQIYMKQGKFREAKEKQLEAIDNYTKLNKATSVVGARVTLTVIYNLAGEFSKALAIANEAEHLRASTGSENKPLQMYLYLARGETYLGLKQLEDAESHIAEVIKSGFVNLLPDAYRCRGEIQLKFDAVDDALTAFYIAIRQARRNQDPYLEAWAWRSLGKAYKKKVRQKEKSEQNRWHGCATKAFHKAIDLFDSIKLSNEVSTTQELLKKLIQHRFSTRSFCH